MNVVLLVVDSLRASSLGQPGGPRTPFLDRLGRETICFRRAFATECWTLPAHVGMFTGLLPSEHGAHFRTMRYADTAPTVAEVLADAGHHTEVMTRNTLFDGTVPGLTRGFRMNTRVLGDLGRGAAPLAVLLALAKPRVRRLIRRSGFFHALQRENGAFLMTLARVAVPADRALLAQAIDRMDRLQRANRPYFLFLNLYDVHAPYAPSADSPLPSLRTPGGWIESGMLVRVLPRVSGHDYLRPGFRLASASRRMLLRRYHRAIELMDAKLAEFWDAARAMHLLDDTLLVVTSDHGEAFGEHGLYFHDASVWNTHLHVPLWIHHPACTPRVVDDVVSTRDLFGLLRGAGLGRGLSGGILDPERRAAAPVALAEHFHYPHAPAAYAQDLAAAVVGSRKAVVTREGVSLYDLATDRDEWSPLPASVDDFEAICRDAAMPREAVDAAVNHLRRRKPTAVAA